MQYVLLILLCLTSVSYAGEWEFQFVQPTVQAQSDSYYITMFTADWCAYCNQAYKTTVPDLAKRGIVFRPVNVDTNPKWKSAFKARFVGGDKDHKGIVSLPTFWVVKVSNGEESIVKEFVGATSSRTLIDSVPTANWSGPDVSLLSKSVSEVKKPVYSVFNVYNGKPNNSHTNRQSLINHLLNDGIHRGRYGFSYLNNLSDTDLDSLHSLDHNIR